MRLYGVTLSDLAWLLENIEAQTPSQEPGRMEIDGPTPDGRSSRVIVPSARHEVIVTLYPLSPPPGR